MAKGWHQESARHALASRGMKSAKHQSVQVMSKSSKTSRINEAMNGKVPDNSEIIRFENAREYAKKKYGTRVSLVMIKAIDGKNIENEDEGDLRKAREALIKHGYLKEAKKVHMQVDEFTSFDEYLKKEHPNKDSDGDGVKNKKDCVPSDPNKQGKAHTKFSSMKGTSSNQWYGEVSKTPVNKAREQVGSRTEKIQDIEMDIRDDLGAKDASDIEANWKEYKKQVAKRIPDKMNRLHYLVLEDDNFHTLNKALDENKQWL